jgi:undecaprenyl-diphosphatase
MTTFQAIIYAAVHGLSEFLPISSSGHHILIPYLVGWHPPTAALISVFTLGSLLALLVYFRHDWASMVSCFLQVIIFRKRPMTLDERLPMFLGVSCIPIAVASSYFHDRIAETEWSPLLVAGVLTVTSIPLWGADYLGRKMKGMFDWNWFDAIVIGLIHASAIIPGWDRLSAVLLGASFLNYKREPAAKYAYFLMIPILLFKTVSGMKEITFKAGAPAPDLTWLSFGVALIVSWLVGLLAIGGFMKHVQQKNLNQYIIYRWVIAAAVCGTYWMRS